MTARALALAWLFPLLFLPVSFSSASSLTKASREEVAPVVVHHVIDLVAQSLHLGRSLLAVSVTGVGVVQQDVLLVLQFEVVPGLAALLVDSYGQLHEVQLHHLDVVLLGGHDDPHLRLALRAVASRGGNQQTLLVQDDRPAVGRLDEGSGHTALHCGETLRLAQREPGAVGTLDHKREGVEDLKRQPVAVAQADLDLPALFIVIHRIEERTVADRRVPAHGIHGLALREQLLPRGSAVVADLPIPLGIYPQPGRNAVARDRPGRYGLALAVQQRAEGGAVVEAVDPESVGIDAQHRHQSLDPVSQQDIDRSSVAELQHVTRIGLPAADHQRRLLHQRIQSGDGAVDLADLALESSHPHLQRADLLPEIVGLLTGREGQRQTEDSNQKFLHKRIYLFVSVFVSS